MLSLDDGEREAIEMIEDALFDAGRLIRGTSNLSSLSLANLNFFASSRAFSSSTVLL